MDYMQRCIKVDQLKVSDNMEREIRKRIYGELLDAPSKAHKQLELFSLDAKKTNEELLMKILNDNKDTAYGIKYDFKNIKSIKEYQENVPISEYDDYIDFLIPMVFQGVENLLTVYPVKHYNKSSGTLGNPKKIPISEVAQQLNFLYSLPFVLHLITEELGDKWKEGKIFIIGQYNISSVPSGATYGALTAKLADNMKDYFDILSTSPAEVLVPQGDLDTHYLQSLYALREKNTTIVISAYFSYFLEILRYMEDNHEMLIEDIRNGTINSSINLSPETREILEEKLTPMPERADELEEIFSKPIDNTFVKLIWPDIQAFEGIGTSTFETYVEKIREKYANEETPILYLGLQASEGIFSTPLELNNKNSVLIPNAIFFEFRPVEQEGYDNLLTIDQLEVGKDYEIILTNLSGFYRYKIKDVVRVTGMHNTLPEITFKYRLNQTVNLTGEKTTEEALRESVKQCEEKYGFDCVDFTVFADTEAVPMNYNFLIEPDNIDDIDVEALRADLEKNLGKANPSFGSKIENNTFGETKLEILQKETFMLYRDLMAMKGVSVVQLKPPRIIVNEVQRKFFYALREL